MDRDQEELQFLGFFGIIKESMKIIFTRRKLFSQITLTLILPLSFIFLAHFQISQLLFLKINDDRDDLNYIQEGTPQYKKLSGLISSEWTKFWLFKLAYFTFLMILSLVSTSAVVYTIACIYTGKDISFKKVMSVVPKVWKRLMVTLLWSFAIVFVYNIILGTVFLLIISFLWLIRLRISMIVVLAIIYVIGLVYVNLVWQLASVVSVLEDLYGIKAMSKSRKLIQGKVGISLAMFLLLVICFVGVELLFEVFDVIRLEPKLRFRIGIGVLCLLLLVKVFLFGLVAQTVLYFVCKSYHHENIDKSSLSDHLEVYLGEYVPLKSKDVQLEQVQV